MKNIIDKFKNHSEPILSGVFWIIILTYAIAFSGTKTLSYIFFGLGMLIPLFWIVGFIAKKNICLINSGAIMIFCLVIASIFYLINTFIAS
ncbi:hypothetical protein [Pelosinus baikalensis]|uniref:Uncharacterized protein n=1 Tax=Pelosinus baikalensis TaxID=2892015 RepID=A0ABS8I0E9_9FIRM|nr:hypothetical protein [Pelosinus baikalensis]MCC5468023.1 hypothetical protein [Pelosinus baikalensis]